MKTHSLKHSILGTVAFTRNNSRSSNQPCCQVVNNVPIQVGHNQHVKLVRVLYELQPSNTDNEKFEQAADSVFTVREAELGGCTYLHATVINDYVLIFDFGVQFCHLRTALQEQAIC